MRMLGNILLIN